ncbi:MAG: FkbM family methyltransferase [Kiritimatiellia bacterium]|jgi:FkbM family methyltransferase
MNDKKLIYDVGMNNGDDTAYYLHKGFRVLAIEADPVLCAAAEERFADEVASGDLCILNEGVADSTGTADFWVNEEKSVWSSFDKEAAGRRGHELTRVDVPTRPFANILEELGTPYYLKIDIEGNDQLCLDALDEKNCPEYISVECNKLDFVHQLYDVGYRKFKMIDQQTFCPLSQPLLIRHRWHHFLNDRLRNFSIPSRIMIKLASRTRVDQWVHDLRSQDGWHFNEGCSGPFAEDTYGSWQSKEIVSANFDHFTEYLARRADNPYQYWFDLHATGAE